MAAVQPSRRRRGFLAQLLDDDERINHAAHSAVFGVSPRWFINVNDPVELMVVEAITNRAIALQEQRDKNLAILIGNELAKRMK